MSKRKVILQEAEQWKREGIISDEQYEQIAVRYPARDRAGTLSIMGGILLGLGVLTFIASNWDGMTHLTRLLLILLSLVAVYLLGDFLHRRGSERLGTAFIVIGVGIYGAGFFLIGQMYHLSGHPLTPFYLWFIGAITLAWHYRSQTLSLISLLILTAASFYGLTTDSREGISGLILYVLYGGGLFPLLWKLRSVWLSSATSVILLGTAVLDVAEYGNGLLVQLPILVYLFAAVLIPERMAPFPSLFRVVGYIGMTLFAVIVIFGSGSLLQINLADTVGSTVILLAVLGYLFLSMRQRTLDRAADMLPHLPLPIYYLLFGSSAGSTDPEPMLGLDVAMILALYGLSIAMVLGGEKRHDVQRINAGAVMFGVTSFVAYVNFAWDFMDKSLFFLIGGAFLLALSFALERQRRRWVKQARRDPR
ncbi:DUF2157 domain-containing protein [Brevibacillus humidisoli]|uniref:DUF2157 domain-containing protein n=1 Tax=Brevibacillus humidisoli TaxID=2895522 RepID=UPI001E30ADF7|nr:DUF2157 domain-containing protein [Brevibacillus humidisoli]UFJ43052.1 DUF2157 domain-containing protein [Brevibacillus humidisoli]